jgi:uncharacterized protein (TIGR02001 family)
MVQQSNKRGTLWCQWRRANSAPGDAGNKNSFINKVLAIGDRVGMHNAMQHRVAFGFVAWRVVTATPELAARVDRGQSNKEYLRMNKMAKCMIAGTLLAASGAANAQFSSTITAATDYDFRGITQSAKDPALQISADYAFGESGFAVGAWASNVDFGEGAATDYEVDLYGSFTQEFESGFSWNAGLVWYSYHPGGDDIDYGEVYLGMGYQNFSAKIWYADDYSNSSFSGTYLEANYTQPLPQDWALTFHVGSSDGDYWEPYEYIDWSVGVTKSLGHFDFALKYIDGSDISVLNDTPGDVFSSDAKVWFSVATTFPWGD